MNVFGEGPLGELPFKLNKLHAFGLLLLLFIFIYFYFFLGGGGGHCSLTETAFKNESVHNFVPDLGQKMSTRNAVWIRCIGLSVWISTSRQTVHGQLSTNHTFTAISYQVKRQNCPQERIW